MHNIICFYILGLKFYSHNRFGWFRFFGIGLKWKDTSIHRLMFSERTGHRGFRIGKWYIGKLKEELC
jgi:hypothetical protein